MTSWLSALEESWIGALTRESLWAYPVVETIHILGFCVVVGAALLFDLRLLGVSARLDVKALEQHVLRAARISMGVVAPTGFVLFAANAVELSSNRVFLLKLALITFAGVNALAYSRAARLGSADRIGKLNAICSLTLWFAVVTCGRFLAYL